MKDRNYDGAVRAIDEGAGAIRRFFAGVGFLGRGLARWGTTPRLMLLGTIPALIVGLACSAGIVVLALNLRGLVVSSTPFASSWLEPWQTLVRIAIGAAIVGLAVLLIVVTFTALTLAIGDQFYERVWRAVENQLGGLPPGSPRSWTSGVADGFRMLVRALLGGLLLFLCGFLPIVGQTIVPVVAAFFAGWMLTVELTSRVFDWRGIPLRERRRMLRGDRAGALGFGLATYLVFLVPLGAVVAMPAAVAGATLLARSVLPPAGLEKPQSDGDDAHPR